MYACVFTSYIEYIYTYIHAYSTMHTYMHTYIHTYSSPKFQTSAFEVNQIYVQCTSQRDHIHTYIHTYIHTDPETGELQHSKASRCESQLDDCNGKVLANSKQYAYFVTPNPPFIPTCMRGVVLGGMDDATVCVLCFFFC
jgi:hypothetical protein